MNCQEVRRWIGPLLDGELDVRNSTDVQAHIAACPACRRQQEVQRTLSASLRRPGLSYEAPASLRQRIAVAVAAEAAQADAPGARADAPASLAVARGRRDETRASSGHARGPSRWLLLAGWPVALAASALLATVLLQRRSQVADDIVAAHIRSLQANHLSDVISTSHHTVKPWFAGKINFSPPVPDLSALGFELAGGRLDYIDRRAVAAVVYRKHGHIINVLVSPAGLGITRLSHDGRSRGYSLRAWRQAEFDLVAVSDIDPRELASLQQGFESPPPQPTD